MDIPVSPNSQHQYRLLVNRGYFQRQTSYELHKTKVGLPTRPATSPQTKTIRRTYMGEALVSNKSNPLPNQSSRSSVKATPVDDTNCNKHIWILFEIICDKIRKSFLEDGIVDVYPGYQAENPEEPVFVMLTKKTYQGEWDKFKGYRLYKRRYDFVNTEAAKVVNSEKVRQNPLTLNDFRQVRKAIRDSRLHEKHSNIAIVNACPCRSRKGGDEIEKELCIVLHCLVKGIIPFGEDPFPESISGIPVDVREGYFFLGMMEDEDVEMTDVSEIDPVTGIYKYLKNDESRSNISLRTGKKSTEYNERLLMGSGIGPEGYFHRGSIGGFVRLEQGQLGLLTCAHMFGTPVTIHKEIGCRWVTQPADGDVEAPYSSRSRFGQLYAAQFKPGSVDTTGIDAAIVLVKDRHPTDGEFISVNTQQLRFSGYRENPSFRTGKVLKLDTLQEKMRHVSVLKFGSETGLTKGMLYLQGTNVKQSNLQMKHPVANETIEFFNQIEVLSISGATRFFDLGDSGALVFMPLDDGKELACIGLAIGKTSYDSCIITPIESVFDELGLLEQNFFDFTQSGS